ncbi:hypothetical protein GCM10009785_06300 [Brooklawnia cerclae]|uniref:ATP/GTP-binding protein n=1 Tax=Brooklawnia cerclae TaxID=349934 RepID=A0ABX0SDI6_9ACTN|nr:hypothetical protein [Brooklawnia cerclae]
MARRPSKHLRPARPLRIADQSSAHKADGLWVVRHVRPENAVKSYTCPGCLRTIPPGVAHVVAWPHTPPIGSTSGVEFRRHFHTACWNARP